jgi:hypothetical protein
MIVGGVFALVLTVFAVVKTSWPLVILATLNGVFQEDQPLFLIPLHFLMAIPFYYMFEYLVRPLRAYLRRFYEA